MKNADSQPHAAPTPGRVTFLDGQNGMSMLEINTAWSTAEVYLHGAHVTRFARKGESPMLFMSQCSRFAEGQPIRGGVPVIFPWFGMREGLGQHGFARVKPWEIREVLTSHDGSVSVRLRLPECPEAATWPPFLAEYVVTVSKSLTMELAITNRAEGDPLVYEDCLHSYFEVGDVAQIAIRGLKGVTYLDKVAGFARKVEQDDAISIGSEVDRVYLNTTSTVEIVDPKRARRIIVEKDGGASTIVWNPWIAKAHQMPDFGNEEYKGMVCVESGNVAENQITLKPGQTHTLTVRLSSQPFG